MTTQAFEQLRTQVNTDKGLQAQVAACFSSAPADGFTGFEKLVALGKSHGFEFTAEEARGAAESDDPSLSDFELELVSAGNGPSDGTNNADNSDSVPTHRGRP